MARSLRVSVLGTGTMGAGMARSIQRAGMHVTAWNRTPAKTEPLAEAGVAVARDVHSAVEGADVVVTILFDEDAVLAVTDDLTAALGEGSVWLQSATVGPDGIRRLAKRAGDVALVDAPMLGTKQPAEQGSLVPIVSGDSALIEKARPVLDAIGTKTVVAGKRIGEASALKLACNAWIFSITAATAQSLALARALGIEPAQVLEAIDGGPANSPYAQVKGKAMLAGDFAPAFGLDGARKDLGLIAEAALDTGLDRAMIDGIRALFDTASEQGHGEDDMAAVYCAFNP